MHWECLAEPEERELIKLLLDWPKLVQGAADSLEPHRVANYLLETARLVHTWYHKHHVLGEPEHIMKARLVLAKTREDRDRERAGRSWDFSAGADVNRPGDPPDR